MMPDLGKYAVEVMASYAVSLALIAGLVWLSLHRARKARRALEEIETRRREDV
ncbi:heme exporter protein CcmD [Roseovarius sp. SCSIO 43702]|uniref:heme exporter protein CcmD n=1 Tax=Roseovarius sp. SCSIO 43702 TaxID=2823043 RepID=UPI001C731A58|nr:heme exporter protein CcmD [Roseovarius sp. SCSIO 43702]QYX57905.1 heme exporter protein CcmD [Roseovarius sp. SCSIO 43702]